MLDHKVSVSEMSEMANSTKIHLASQSIEGERKALYSQGGNYVVEYNGKEVLRVFQPNQAVRKYNSI